MPIGEKKGSHKSPLNDLESRTDREALSYMIFPTGSNPDHSPLHVVCCNDTCSFTWTGAEHINQVIAGSCVIIILLEFIIPIQLKLNN